MARWACWKTRAECPRPESRIDEAAMISDRYRLLRNIILVICAMFVMVFSGLSVFFTVVTCQRCSMLVHCYSPRFVIKDGGRLHGY